MFHSVPAPASSTSCSHSRSHSSLPIPFPPPGQTFPAPSLCLPPRQTPGIKHGECRDNLGQFPEIPHPSPHPWESQTPGSFWKQSRGKVHGSGSRENSIFGMFTARTRKMWDFFFFWHKYSRICGCPWHCCLLITSPKKIPSLGFPDIC